MLCTIVVVTMVGVSVLSVQNASAQDPQFSQYYAAPVYLNPGLVGINQRGRAGINYRNQWPSIDANFVTYSFSLDYNFEDYDSSVGIIANSDSEGLAGLNSTSLGLLYAYQVRLNHKWTFRPGVELGYYWRDINFDKLTFGDQFDQTGQVRAVTQETFNTGLSANFFDLSLGGVVFNEQAWLGYSVHHILEPNQSINGGSAPLPRKYSLQGGYKIPFTAISAKAQRSVKGRERSFTPSFNYRQQGNFKQLDLGLYFTLEPILLGLWYRGVPIESLRGIANNEAMIAMVGFSKNDLTIGYSFDYTISDLGIGTGGAHEISIVYAFSLADPRKPAREVRELRCPIPFIF